MKRGLICGFLIFSLTMSIFTSCSDDNENIEYTLIEYESKLLDFSDSDYLHADLSDLQMYHASNQLADFYFDKDSYNQDELQDIIDSVHSDIKIITEKSEKRINKLNFYFLKERDNETERRVTHFFENDVYINKNDIGSDRMKSAIAGAAFSISEPWVAHGIAAWIFDLSVNENALWSFWSNVNVYNTLRLFGARFYPDYYLQSEIELAVDTAASFARFIINEYGWDTLIESGFSAPTMQNKHKQEWLASMDIARDYVIADEMEMINFSFYSNNKYPLIIGTEENTYFVGALTRFGVNDQIDSFIRRDKKSRKTVAEYIKANAHKNIGLFDLDALSGIDIYWDYKPGSGTDSVYNENGDVHINDNNRNYLNELIKVSLDANSYADEFDWFTEALATYIALNDSGSYNFDGIQNEYDRPGMGYIVWVRNYYHEKMEENYSDFNKDINPLDPIIMYDGFAHVAYRYADNEFVAVWAEAADGIANTPSELSFIKQVAFVSYLIRTYTLDTVLDMYKNDMDFKKVFGRDYVELRDAWLIFIDA